ncbi:MAG: hypothetical protein DRO05_00935 [Thermoproteota archaeon]|nr:MAG: hypothetical protein DRO05_00935 [Candidatus Korarchaeota archaeon]
MCQIFGTKRGKENAVFSFSPFSSPDLFSLPPYFFPFPFPFFLSFAHLNLTISQFFGIMEAKKRRP